MVCTRIEFPQRFGKRAVRIGNALLQNSCVGWICFVFDSVLGHRCFNRVAACAKSSVFREPALLHTSGNSNADQERDQECDDGRREQSASRVVDTAESFWLSKYGPVKFSSEPED